MEVMIVGVLQPIAVCARGRAWSTCRAECMGDLLLSPIAVCVHGRPSMHTQVTAGYVAELRYRDGKLERLPRESQGFGEARLRMRIRPGYLLYEL